MKIIPVLDLLNGIVVRGIQGERDKYRPIVSRLAQSTDALSVARALGERFDLHEFYVADLDAILNQQFNAGIISQLVSAGFELMVDAGVRDANDARAVFRAGAQSVIAALETVNSPAVLSHILRENDVAKVIFSLDLKNGAPCFAPGSQEWHTTAIDIARQAVDCGCRRMIVLDIGAVGAGSGVPTLELCNLLRSEFGTELELITGGGVNSGCDLNQLFTQEINGCLIASALHDGRIQPDDIQFCSATD